MSNSPSATLNAPSQAAGKRSTWVSVVVNIVLMTLQITVGVVAGSQAVIADGIHSVSDLASDLVVLFAGHHSQKEADDDHQYGHHRYENAASMVLGAVLLGVGVLMLGSAALTVIADQVRPPVSGAALAVAVFVIVAKETLFRYMYTVAKQLRSSLLMANAWHARSDAASSLVVAIGVAANMLGYPVFDTIAALIVGLMIVKMGWEFFWDALHDLMDRGLSEQERQELEAVFLATPGVVGVHDLRTRKMGDSVMVDAHLEVDGTLTVAEGHDIAVAARKRVLERPEVINVMLHVDPVYYCDLPTRPSA